MANPPQDGCSAPHSADMKGPLGVTCLMASVLNHNPKQLKIHPIQEKPLQDQICQVSGLSHLPSCNAVSQEHPTQNRERDSRT